jgi:ubiquinone/menaquinone biosynthesis C-methylase UbiE
VKRVAHVEELLDGDLDDPAALVGNLRDLRRVNRLLGGVRLSRLAIEALGRVGEAGGGSAGMPASILDVGAGGADIPVALLADARRRGHALRVVATDSRDEVLAAAVVARPGLDSIAGLTLEVADGRSLPHPDASFDVAHCSLVVHHLEPDEAVGLLGEMARVARIGVVVNDLSRSRPAWLGAWLAANLLTRNRYTRNDAPLSIARAYTLAEIRDLLARAGLRPVAEIDGFFGHRYAIAAVRA